MAALSLSGCSATPTLTIPLDVNWQGSFSALIFDDTRLVTGGRQLPFGEHQGSGAFAHPDRNEIEVAWTGGACSHHPTVALSGTADALRVRVTNPPDTILAMDCPLIGLFEGITLNLTQSVHSDALHFEVTE